MWVPLTFVALAALLVPRSFGKQLPTVPSPAQIVVTSENLKTVLHWQYPAMSETPRFIVEVKPYDLGRYKNVSTCVNIAAHFCDLSKEIYGPGVSHWFRVKAVVGSQESEYVETEEFLWRKHGKIGPPKLDLSRHSNKIMVDIYHPAFPSEELLPWIEDIYSQLSYSVTFWDWKNQTEEEFYEETCTMYKCSLNIPVPAEGHTYCVSAKGSWYSGVVVGAPSEARCIRIPLGQIMGTPGIVTLCGVILSLSLMLTVYFGCKKLRKKNIKLPKSLVNVIRNLNSDSILESKSTTKYVSVSVIPSQSALPENFEATFEVEQIEETGSPKNSSEGESSEAPAKAEEESVQENIEEVSSDDDQNHKVKETYFISNSSKMDICSNSSGQEISATEIQQTVIPSSSFKFSGYDKPHVPLNMLIDVGEEQPVIAYSPANQDS